VALPESAVREQLKERFPLCPVLDLLQRLVVVAVVAATVQPLLALMEEAAAAVAVLVVQEVQVRRVKVQTVETREQMPFLIAERVAAVQARQVQTATQELVQVVQVPLIYQRFMVAEVVVVTPPEVNQWAELVEAVQVVTLPHLQEQQVQIIWVVVAAAQVRHPFQEIPQAVSAVLELS
jgi:predicted dithiol-disulfide oxidoreductase (DUF899 family)